MKQKNQNKKKLSLQKTQMTKIANLNKIFGVTKQHTGDCLYPENGSYAPEHDGGGTR